MSFALDVEDIRLMLPHRYPMLLVDRIIELDPGVRAVGLKNVTINEPFFNGHFPGQAVMPGVLIIEAMAQVAGLMILSVPGYNDKLAYIAEVEKIRFRRPVLPGDALVTEAVKVWIRGTHGKVRMWARVDGALAAEGEVKFALKEPDRRGKRQPRGSSVPSDGSVSNGKPAAVPDQERGQCDSLVRMGDDDRE